MDADAFDAAVQKHIKVLSAIVPPDYTKDDAMTLAVALALCTARMWFASRLHGPEHEQFGEVLRDAMDAEELRLKRDEHFLSSRN